MKAPVNIQSPQRHVDRCALSAPGRRRLLWALCFFIVLASRPDAWTQNPAVGPPALTGSTHGANLRNAAAATQTQLDVLFAAVDNWRQRAGWANYDQDHFRQDFGHVQSQFQALRTQFNWLAELALQLGRARANNAVAELDAGLEIIAEPLGFLEGQFTAGTLDRTTLIRTVSVFQKALREWEREFRKNSSRLQLTF